MPIAPHLLFRKPPEFHRAGTIRLGIKVDTGQRRDGKPVMRPSEVDYFVLPEDLRERHRELGLDERPKELTVAFPVDDLEQLYPMHIDGYGSSFLKFRCDGETCVQIDTAGAETRETCWRQDADKCRCEAKPISAKALGRLNVIVATAGHTNVYQVLIGGLRRNANLVAEIMANRAILAQAGARLSGAWFKLTRELRDVQVRTETGRTIQHGYPVHCVLEIDPRQVMARMLGAGAVPRALPPPPAPAAALVARPEAEEADFDAEEVPAAPSQANADGPGSTPTPSARVETAPPAARVDPGGSGALDRDHREGHAPSDLDLSMVIARAVRVLGVSEATFRAYVRATRPDDPEGDRAETTVDLDETLQMVEEGSQEQRRMLKQTILLTANKAKRGAS